MTPACNEANVVSDTVTGTDAKPVWTTPSIESYDVAQFTLSARGNRPGDGISNNS